MVQRSFRSVGAVVMLLASAASASDDDKPRVMVILDTSKSMTEKPRFVLPTDIDITYPMSTAGGDFDSATMPPCLNKFCTAKEVLYQNLPGYVDSQDAHIGLSTYFQYIVKAHAAGTGTTTCSYDVLSRPGELRQFTSFLDFTNSGSTVCAGGPSDLACPASTRATSFPDAWTGGGSGASLYGFCNTPAGYTRPTDLMTPVPTCSGADCYLLTKTSATPQTPLTCDLWTRPSVITLPHPYYSTNSQCPTANYQSVSTTTIPAVVTGIQIGVSRTTTTCSGTVVPQSTTPPIAAASKNYTALPTACGATASTGCIRNAGTLACTTGAPCDLFLENSAPVVTNTGRSWYGLFDDTFVPDAGYRGSNSYSFSTRTGSVDYTPGLLTGSVTNLALTTACQTTGRYATGTTATFGITGARNTLIASPIVGMPTGYVNNTPNGTGTNLNCTPDWPCDVTFVSDVTVPGGWGTAYTGYNTTSLPATTRISSGPTTNTYWTRVTDPAVTSCAALVPGNPTSAPTGTIWTSSTPTGCGTGVFACTFSGGTSGSATASSGTCVSPITKYQSGAPANCSFNGKSYVLGSSTNATVTKTVPALTGCTTGTFTITDATGYSGAPGVPADLTFTSQSPGTPENSAPQVLKSAVPSGYSGAPSSESNRGAVTLGPTTASTSNICADSSGAPGSASAGDEIASSSNSTLCAGSTPCTLLVVGMVQTSTSGCGSEGSSPCHACQYQPRQFVWSRPTYACNYTATTYTYTVNRTALTCAYTRQQWQLQDQLPSTHTCNYAMGARRYDFLQPTEALCRYWAVKTQVVAPQNLYTYQYLTKGTEIIGRAAKSGISSNLCPTTWSPTNTFGTTCPETVANCNGLTSTTYELTTTGGPSAGTTCRLQYGGSANNEWWTGFSFGRYSNFSGANNFDPVSTASSRACEASAPPANSNDFKDRDPPYGTPVGFCSSSGTPASDTYSLVSDWYDPTISNDKSVYDALYPPSSYTTTWNNNSTKTQGASTAGGTSTVTTGGLPPRSLFVPIATGFDATQAAALRTALDKCIPPSIAAPNADGSLQGGACISDTYNASAPGYTSPTSVIWKDMTPLYGSLKNTRDYLLDRFTTDDSFSDCRPYYIVLATDGLESTPKGYVLSGTDPATSVQGLVGSFRNTSTATPRTAPDIKTFVIAFGEGAAGATGLDDVANAGGTFHAYSATSQAELTAALNAVFTTITQGTFSRSKPALGTDGKRLYSAQYTRPGPDGGINWSGSLTAYKISTIDGSLSIAWEWSQKLNNATAQPSRNINIGLRKIADHTKTVVAFHASDPEVDAQLSSRTDYPSPALTTSALETLLRTKGGTYSNGTIRDNIAAPIVNSNPIIIAKSPFDIDYGGTTATAKADFLTFVSNTASRGTRVMFEANDGMVHSIVEASPSTSCTTTSEADPSCPNGTEAWAYIPGSLRMGKPTAFSAPTLVESLFTLWEGQWNNYIFNNSLAIADICADGTGNSEACTAANWRTIAIGSQRNGGRGMFAVDVTGNGLPDTAAFLWDLENTDLGYTHSVPVVGRVKNGGHDNFVAVFGGGMDDPNTTSVEGLNVWVVNAMTGTSIRTFSSFTRGTSTTPPVAFTSSAIARPASYRRPANPNSAYMDSVFAPIGPAVYALRLTDADGTPNSNPDNWQPDEFFDPLRHASKYLATCPTTPCGITVVNEVYMADAGVASNPNAPPLYALRTVSNMPLSSAPPILNRPKLSAQLVPNGAQTDLFVGTGDTNNPASPLQPDFSVNYFYAIHDFNQQAHGSQTDGRPLWVVKFPLLADGQPEEIVSEPALISGCVVVATYHPPSTHACALNGDTTLYGFRPLDGALQPCLVFPASSPWAGAKTPVVTMPGVGIPSDLVVVNDNVYLSTSAAGLMRAPVRPAPMAGDVRSYRRIK